MYLRNLFKNVLPGSKLYASVVKKIGIIGDCHVDRIKKNLFNHSIGNNAGHISCFSVANTKHLPHFILPTLHEDKLDAIVLHVGSNDLTSKDTTIDINIIVDGIIGIGKTCKDYGAMKLIVPFLLLKSNF